MRESDADFSEMMREKESIRKMIEDLKYDGNNLARYMERKRRGVVLRTECVKFMKDSSISKNREKEFNKEKILIEKIQYQIKAIDAFKNDSNYSKIVSGDQDQIYRLVLDARKRALEALSKMYVKDKDQIEKFIAK